MSRYPTAAVIGAGSSGIAAAKALRERGVPHTVFEASDRVGGVWVFGNRNGLSAAYRGLHINTSRDRMEFSDFPMPKTYPDYPHHTQIAAYFDAYADHFGLRESIRFRTRVEHARRGADGVLDARAARRVDRALRRPARRQRPSLEPALARAALPRPRHVRRHPDARPRLPRARAAHAAGASSCSGWATARWTSRSSPPTSPSARSSPPAAARGSCPSTSSAGPPTSCPTIRGCRSGCG